MSAAESSLSSQNVVAVIGQLQHQSSQSPALDRLLNNAAMLADTASLKSILAKLSDTAAVPPTDENDDSVALTALSLTRLALFVEAWSRRVEHELQPGSDEMRTIWKPAMDSAVKIVESEEFPPQLRTAAVQLVAEGPFLGESHTESLAMLLTARTPPELQLAVVAAMRKDGSARVAEFALSDWAGREPRLRKELIALLVSRPEWTTSLLSAIADGTVSRGEIDLSQQQQLFENPVESIRTAATKSFTPRTSASRQQVIDRYTAALTNSGDPGKGRLLFQKHCSNCHRLQDTGHVVGPDISAYSGKPAQSLLIAMLNPNQAVDPRYQSYVVLRNDGRSVTGLIAEESASSLTLLAAEAKREAVLRSEIEAIHSTGKSLMPEGFEQNASAEDVNDLWAFFRTLHAPPKKLEGNQPEIVEIPSEGNVALSASKAEIFGRDITFERPFQNVGYWHHKDDNVRWKIHSSAIRQVDLWAEWACDPAAAGSKFEIDGAEPVLKGAVRSTGGWDRYQLFRIGRVTISEGASELVIRPASELPSAMVDLRALHLVTPGGVPLAAGNVN